METKVYMESRINVRGKKENFFDKTHITIKDLLINDQMKGTDMYGAYLSKDIPNYPTPIEFHITELVHVTNKMSLPKIWKSGGFKGFGEHSLSWWSLKINEADITSAEERYLEKRLPNRSDEERAAQPPFLRDFTTSPLFLKTSRYGNFRFTFPIHELMEAYKKQMCAGEEPVLRVYETKCFKKEIEYVVLVHSPEFNDLFSDFPELSSSSVIVAYDGDQILWKAQAICGVHKYQLMINGNIAGTQKIGFTPYYVWDQVSFVFHTNEVLAFPKKKLKENLSCCEINQIQLVFDDGGICSSIEEAEKFIQALPDNEFEKEERV